MRKDAREPTTRRTVLNLPTPVDFDFTSTVFSHGWCSLLPFFVNRSTMDLERILTLPLAGTVLCACAAGPQVIRASVFSRAPLAPTERAVLQQAIRRMFRLDEDLRPFHRSLAADPHHGWIAARRAGRLLRAPTVFEDLVKMICTTNCSWSLTTAMVTNLCKTFGERFDTTRFAFPTPEAIAASSERVLRVRVKAGYRAPFLLDFARSVCSGSIDPEQWGDPALPVEEVYGRLRQVKGVGEYAAGNLLKLLGHYDYLGLDSWVRARYYKLHHKGRKVTDRSIEKRYRSYGRWRGLLFWLEMTRDWYDDKFPLLP